MNKNIIHILFLTWYCLQSYPMMNKLRLRHSRSYDYKRKPLVKKQKLIVKEEQGIFCKTFPLEIDKYIINQVATKNNEISLKDTAQGINSLAQVNNFLNTFINDNQRTLGWIKKISKQYNVSNLEVARRLCTSAAKNRFALQKATLYEICYFNCTSPQHTSCERTSIDFKLFDSHGLDLEFTYDEDQTRLLMSAAQAKVGYCCPLPMKLLLDAGANINTCNLKKQNAAMIMLRMYGGVIKIERFFANLEYLKININDQDIEGNTLFHYCIEELKSRHTHHDGWRDVNMDEGLVRIQTLLAKGANPTIKNNKGQTPLELGLCPNNLGHNYVTKIGCRNIIKLLQEAEKNWNVSSLDS